MAETGLLLLGVLALASCRACVPVPSVDPFNGNVSTAPAAQEVYLTVRGATQGPIFSDFQDYTETLAITFNDPGTVEAFATVTASDGSIAFKMVEVSVTAEGGNRGSVSNPVRLTVGGAAKQSKVGSGSSASSYIRVDTWTNTAGAA